MSRVQLFLITLVKLAINISLRAVYPFAPALARGLGISTLQLTDLIALRNFTGILSPLFGPMSERFGRRLIIVAGALLFAGASFSVGIWPTVGVFAAMLILTALAKVIFDPATYGLLGDTVPYQRRGRYTGFLELSWAGGMFIGAPLTGLLLGLYGWTMPFVFLGGFTLLGSGVLWLVLPEKAVVTGMPRFSMNGGWASVRRAPIVWAVVAFVFTTSLASELVLINIGVWLESRFASPIAAVGELVFGSRLAFLGGIGVVTMVIGVGDAVGEVFILLFSDRIGKRRLVLISGIVLGGIFLSLAALADYFWAAMGIVLLLFFFYEVTYVTGLPLFIERLPQARAVMHAMVLAGTATGRLTGGWVGSRLWAMGGIELIALTAAVVIWLGMGLFFFMIEEAA